MESLQVYSTPRLFSKPDFTLATVLLAGVIFTYQMLYPPFVSHVAFPPMVRLLVEALTLVLLLSAYWLNNGFGVAPQLLWASFFVGLYGLFGGDQPEQVFSFFNKMLYFVLLIRVMDRYLNLYLWVRRLWIWLWLSFFAMSFLAVAAHLFGILSFRAFPYPLGYPYQFHPLVGNLLQKNILGIWLPRYTGWIDEPGLFAFFCGLNLFMARDLFIEAKHARRYALIATLAGILSLSYTFYLYLALWFGFVWIKKARIGLGLVAFLIFIFAFPPIVYIVFNPDALPNSSALVRIDRLVLVLNKYLELNLWEMFFGIGILPMKELIQGGATAGVVQVIFSRGLLLFCFFAWLLYYYSRHNFPLLLFFLYFSLTFDFFWYPLFLTAIALSFLCYRHNAEPLELTIEAPA
ncbi:MAG: hypothetical protein A2527_00070 [Candidatus Lambdaproteobacteria bacterium RIFOXYD2_FULL_50_16]|uniref:Uncharacterized protein n=1 Tax=Candidatus Lambdaproteobacteria bacterium RIFOXYD2_FULL_50_16 TaxID=1817772 RepID=A0A1F6GFN1_9PROT|nr:MAG: hypothetical protein A2527_00070 [Candidatus Lambdaproteobacteria bacterium RIFOXYD2_FULL_50_16]